MVTSPHILIASKAPSTHGPIEAELQSAGYRVALAENSEEAFEKVAGARQNQTPFDLVVADPEIVNWNRVRLVPQLGHEGIDIPVIVTSGKDNQNVVIQRMASRGDASVGSAWSGSSLMQTVKHVLGSSKLASEENEILLDHRHSLKRLRGQVDSAVDAYQSLVHPCQDRYKVPVEWRSASLAELGGDFLDISDTVHGCDLLIADVAGHDYGASYHAVLIKALFTENCRQKQDGLWLLRALNKQLVDNGRNDRMVTALFLRLDTEAMVGELVCAGHPPVILVRQASPGTPLALHADGTILGVDEDVRFDVYRFELTPGDRLFLYTDGILDSRRFSLANKRWEKLGLTNLKNLLRMSSRHSLKETVDNVWKSVLGYCDHQPQDDMMLVGVEVPVVMHAAEAK